MSRRIVLAALLVVPFRLALAESVSLTEVRFIGNRRVPRESFEYYVKSLAGKPLDLEQAIRDTQTLLALGLFEDVRLETRPEPLGTSLNFFLEERPFVSSVTYSGLVAFDNSHITEMLRENQQRLEPATPYDPYQAWRAARTIKSTLRASGHAFARVDVRTDPVGTGPRPPLPRCRLRNHRGSPRSRSAIEP